MIISFLKVYTIIRLHIPTINNMRSLFLTISFCLIALTSCAEPTENKGAKSPKYVFYFISDGTGANIVQAAEHYRADIIDYTEQGIGGETYKYAPKMFEFSTFPVVGMATTYSASSRVTDSAASGTALASGHKTINGYLGVMPDKVTPVYSILKYAKEKGMSTGVASNVYINHATPGAFFGHNESRNNYHEIAHDFLDCDYVDFFGGSGVRDEASDKCKKEKSILAEAEKKGIAVCRGTQDYDRRAKKAEKVLLIQPEGCPWDGLPYVIDRKPDSKDITIEQILEKEVDFLYNKGKEKGFVLMNEIGGKVDYACHSNDAATAFMDLEAVNNCIKIALEFYKQHPDETLIVLTADHDTGAPSLSIGQYEMRLKKLQTQKISKDSYTDHINRLRKETNNNVTWGQIEKSLKELWGFWTVHTLTPEQEKLLKDTYEETLGAGGKQILEKNLYKSNEKMSSVTCKIMGNISHIGFHVGSHSAGYVPVYAIGPGAEEFTGMNDNAMIVQKIAKLLNLELKAGSIN